MLWDDESAFEPKLQVVTTPWGTYDVAVLRRVAAEVGEPGDVDVLWHVDSAAVDRTWSGGVDLASPLVLVAERVVDGRHRLYKAERRGRAVLPGWHLTPAQAAAAVLSPERLAQIDADDAAYRGQWASA